MLHRKIKKEQRAQLKALRQQEREQKAQEEAMLKRGEGSDHKPIRSKADGKENELLKPHLNKYLNVDDNIVTVKHKLCPYQLVHEGTQFRMENPQVRKKKLAMAHLDAAHDTFEC